VSSLSIRARLIIWYSLALAAALTAFAAAVLWQQSRIAMLRVDHELEAAATTLGNVLRDELTETADTAAAAAEARATIGSASGAIAIFDSTGRPLAASWNGLALSGAVPLDAGAHVWTVSSSPTWRVRTERVTFGATTMILLAAAPLGDLERGARELRQAVLVGIPLALLLAAGGGLLLATSALRPLTRMAQRAAALPVAGADNLGEEDRTDELGQLARSFNGLVGRLRAALSTQRRFMADASHELRTPVSVIRSAAEVTLLRTVRADADYRDALGIVGDEARRLGALVEDMLVLARADAGGYTLDRVDFYLDDVLAGCVRALEIAALERNVTIHADRMFELPMRGDEDLVRRMLLNVLQNAVQHTADGTSVDIAVERTAATTVVRVRDHGAGIREGDRERIFERFVQLDPARRSSGTGLGLPIARWIAEAHGGKLKLETSGDGGSTFAIELPSDVYGSTRTTTSLMS
jgi:signal transduction histidine kinase